MALDGTQVWHDDGHVIHLMLNGPDLSIVMTQCPSQGDKSADCWNEDIQDCVVCYFLQVYGLDCNVGSCSPSESMQVAWSSQGNARHVDEMQVWVIPIDDDMFSSWRTTQS